MSIYLLNKEKIDGIKNLNVIEISFLYEEISIQNYDAIVFTSKNAVLALNNITKEWICLPSFAIGKATAKEIIKNNGKVAFTGEDLTGNAFAREIIPFLKNKKILYPRAKNILSNLSFILKDENIILDEKIIYETLCKPCKKEEKPPLNSIIIFTSPSTISCFLSSFSWDKSWKAICIGEITKKYLPSYINGFLAKNHSIASCVELAFLLKTKK